jgi:hypothetical protein
MDTVQILHHLKDWSKPIETLGRAFSMTTRTGSKKSKGKAIANPSMSGREIVLPDDPSSEAIAAYNDIHTLWRALQHATTSNLHSILSHMELMTSAVSWFAQVSSYFTDGLEELLNDILSSVMLTSQTLPLCLVQPCWSMSTNQCIFHQADSPVDVQIKLD